MLHECLKVLYSLMKQIPYDQAEKIVSEVFVAVGCKSEIFEAEFLKSYLCELVAIFPEVREHTEERTRMLKLYKEKGLL